MWKEVPFSPAGKGGQFSSFLSIEIVLSGINSAPEDKLESLGSQKVDFFVMGKWSILVVENRPSFSFVNFGAYFSIFHNFRN